MVMPGPSLSLGKTITRSVATVVGSQPVCDPNRTRTYALFVNDSASWMYLEKGPIAALNSGIPLPPNGGWYEITLINPYTGSLSVACAVAAQNLCFHEEG